MTGSVLPPGTRRRRFTCQTHTLLPVLAGKNIGLYPIAVAAASAVVGLVILLALACESATGILGDRLEGASLVLIFWSTLYVIVPHFRLVLTSSPNL